MDVRAVFEAAKADLVTHVQKGTQDALDEVTKEAKGRTPYREGTLRDSAEVMLTEEGGVFHGVIHYNLPYANRQHEELTWTHLEGQAKYLESAAEDLKPRVAAILEAAIERGTR
ncbi:hypothetical protein C1Y63_04735 [Corynebacterium sp. 13CS0277]|uniref:HK97 gp10 family phage protein n=1 Tax=Corynebacterium sp. 13CS0277 TaxID=2071994 RepID=UPI000D03D138|nr:HK97 gp10 family phage protein [Corynebacterium sp. 13CS0277]PRQ11718.1 hypothetical protein C1Y63_04735 [Corynebacterium sp. 13CS0277]